MIRGDLLDSERYWRCTIEARQFFFHVMLNADDFGCISLAPVFLRRRCFNDSPTSEKIATLIEELASADLIRVYLANEARYGFIPRFGQKLKTMKSKCPRPSEALYADDSEALRKFTTLDSAARGEQTLPFGKDWGLLRRQIIARDGHCIRCGAVDNLTAHHITPQSEGGISSVDNLCALCQSCNSWARNNPAKCLIIKELFQKTASGQIPEGFQLESLKRREVEVKRKEEEVPPTATSAPWWKNDAEIQATANSLGLSARPGESFKALKDRIFTELAKRKTAAG